MRLAIFSLAWLCAASMASGQKYTGPVPEKEDVPYILQADNLISTEATTAKEEKGKKETITYVVPGAASTAKTPLASPSFLLKVKEIVPEKLQLYKLDVKNGRREITMGTGKKAKNPDPIRVEVRRLSDDLVRLDVSAHLDNGQYSFSPAGSDDVFCFEVYWGFFTPSNSLSVGNATRVLDAAPMPHMQVWLAYPAELFGVLNHPTFSTRQNDFTLYTRLNHVGTTTPKATANNIVSTFSSVNLHMVDGGRFRWGEVVLLTSSYQSSAMERAGAALHRGLKLGY